MLLRKEFITTLILAAMSLSCLAQHTSAIISQMDKYRDYVYQKQNIYYTIDDMGKVVDVKMGESIPDSIQMEIIGFLKGLPKFYGSGTRVTYIFPSDENEKQPEISKKQFTLSDGSKIAIGYVTGNGESETGEVLRAKNVIVSEPNNPKEEKNKVFDIVQQMPSFPGGTQALMTYLSTFIRYPEISENLGAEGRVIVNFIVEKDGSISNAQVARGCDYYLEKEAVRVVMAMPKWNPGMQNNAYIRVKYTLPITFRLQ